MGAAGNSRVGALAIVGRRLVAAKIIAFVAAAAALITALYLIDYEGPPLGFALAAFAAVALLAIVPLEVWHRRVNAELVEELARYTPPR